MRKKFFRVLWTFFILGVLAIGITFFLIFKGVIGYMPDIQQLQNPVNKFATQVFSADGKQLGTWSYSSANRVFADYSELPPALVQALIATEDVRFYEHNGIDFMALMRVFWSFCSLKAETINTFFSLVIGEDEMPAKVFKSMPL